MPFGADAAGLGRLTVQSYLGQPLSAEVELVSIQKNETITARIAPPDVYTRANLNYDAVLGTARVAVQNRPNGEPYLRITTGRPLNEPFLEIIIELNSQHGRVTRQYTALLDPPGYGTATRELPPPVSPPVATVTSPRTAAPPAGPAAAFPVAPSPPPAGSALEAPKPSASPAPRQPAAGGRGRRGRTPAAAPASGAQNQYGPIQRGETLGRIARSVKPEGVTLEQTLVGLYRENPDAFIRNNMNLVKSGKILRVPDATALSAIAASEARTEVRMQAADFNAYRSRLAEKTGIAREEGTVTKGKIGARVADSAAPESPRDTVRVSRGEPGGAKGKGAPRSAQERVRALEEEAIAREKALAEANDRIEKLEKTIKESQKLAELKSGGMAAAQQAAEKAKAQPAPAKKDEPAKKEDAAKKAEPAVVATAPPQPAPGAKVPETATTGAPTTPTPTAGATTGAAPAPDDTKKVDAPKPPAAKAKAAPPPPAEPDYVELVMNEPLYQAGLAAAVIALVAIGMYAVRRRRAQHGDDLVKIAPTLGRGEGKPKPPAAAPVRSEPTGAGAGIAAGAAAAGATATAATPKSPPPQRVQTARAEEPTPAPQPVSKPQPAPPPAAAPADDNDLDFGAAPARAAPPPPPPPPRAPEPPAPPPPEPLRAPEPPPMARAPAPAPVPPPPREQKAAEPMLPDFELDANGKTPPAQQPLDSNLMDFTLDPLPPVGSPEPAAPAPSGTFSTDGPPALDFDLKGLDLDLGKPSQPQTPAGPPRDEHWYDVQQKFDLAKAYEEMGDKDGAREILKEVLKEGDSEQQAQAQKLLGTLG